MSDGPYKSLPMKKAWKDVSERAHKASYSEEERAQSMCVALHKDFKREVGKDYLDALGRILVDQHQGNLLAEQAGFEVDAIHNKFTQAPLRDAVSGHVQAALFEGHRGELALAEGIYRAALEHGHAHIRQVEEHYKRNADNYTERQKTINVRDNLTKTLASDSVHKFGHEIVGLVRGEAVETKLTKAIGLDDGPEFD